MIRTLVILATAEFILLIGASAAIVRYRDLYRSAHADSVAALGVNADALRTIDNLRQSVAGLREQWDYEAKRAEEASREIVRQRDEALEALENERRRRMAIYRSDPDARAWADGLVPVAVADRLRRQGGDSDGRSGNSGSSSGEAPGGTGPANR